MAMCVLRGLSAARPSWPGGLLLVDVEVGATASWALGLATKLADEVVELFEGQDGAALLTAEDEVDHSGNSSSARCCTVAQPLTRSPVMTRRRLRMCQSPSRCSSSLALSSVRRQ